jgi:hypothetical protein
MKVEIEVPDLPAEFEVVGFDVASGDDLILLDGQWISWDMQQVSKSEYFVARKAKQYREPVLPADWGKEVEGYDPTTGEWVRGSLVGFTKYSVAEKVAWDIDNESYTACRIEVSK